MRTPPDPAIGRDDDGTDAFEICASSSLAENNLKENCTVCQPKANATLLIELNLHQQMHGDAEACMWQIFHALYFRKVLRTHGIVRRSEGEGDKHTHALVIAGTTRSEINALLGCIDANGNVFEMLVARF
jgi:hypothetical protein